MKYWCYYANVVRYLEKVEALFAPKTMGPAYLVWTDDDGPHMIAGPGVHWYRGDGPMPDLDALEIPVSITAPIRAPTAREGSPRARSTRKKQLRAARVSKRLPANALSLRSRQNTPLRRNGRQAVTRKRPIHPNPAQHSSDRKQPSSPHPTQPDENRPDINAAGIRRRPNPANHAKPGRTRPTQISPSTPLTPPNHPPMPRSDVAYPSGTPCWELGSRPRHPSKKANKRRKTFPKPAQTCS